MQYLPEKSVQFAFHSNCTGIDHIYIEAVFSRLTITFYSSNNKSYASIFYVFSSFSTCWCVFIKVVLTAFVYTCSNSVSATNFLVMNDNEQLLSFG